MAEAKILIFRSSNRNFPFDLEPELAKAGIAASAVPDLECYIASPVRRAPFLAVFEVGSTADLDRALAAFEWSEKAQPLAPARYLLLLASRNIPLGEKAKRFGATEVFTLPQPARNLLFKLDLQLKLLLRERAPTAQALGFSAQEEVEPGGRRRVLVLRGQGEKAGHWRNEGDAPQGKVRWRWVRMPVPEKAEAEDPGFSWEAESAQAPAFVKEKNGWVLEGEEDSLHCYKSGEEIFAAPAGAQRRKKNAAPAAESAALRPQPPETERGANRSATAERFAEEASRRRAEAEKKAGQAEEGGEDSSQEPGHSPTRECTDPRKKAEGEPWIRAERRPGQPVEEGGALSDRRRGGRPPDQELQATERQEQKIPSPQKAERRENEPLPGAVPGGKAGAPGLVPETAAPEKNRTAGAEAEEIPSVRSHDAEEPAGGRSERVTTWQAEVSERTHSEAESLVGGVRQQGWNSRGEADGGTASPRARERTQPGSASEAASGIFPAVESQPGAERSSRERAAVDAPRAIPEPSEKARGSGHAQEPGLRKEPEAVAASPAPSAAETLGHERENEAPLSQEPEVVVETVRSLDFQARISPDPGASEEKALLRAPELRREEMAIPGAGAGMPEEGVARLPGTLTGGSGPDPEDPQRFLRSRFFVIRSLAELGDRESSWHPLGRFRVYLGAQHRYYGLKHPRDALPVWVYEGELAPEFLDTQGAWKFYDRPPFLVPALEEMPDEVSDFLHHLAGLPIPVRGQAGGFQIGGERGVAPDLTLPREKLEHRYAGDDEAAKKPKGLFARIGEMLRNLLGGR